MQACKDISSATLELESEFKPFNSLTFTSEPPKIEFQKCLLIPILESPPKNLNIKAPENGAYRYLNPKDHQHISLDYNSQLRTKSELATSKINNIEK